MEPSSSQTALPFSAWMERALFAPDTGYYTARINTVGRRGDFSTSATVDNCLAGAIANWIRLNIGDYKCVIEVGGGDGSLSRGIRKALGWWYGRGLEWRMVEKSPVLRGRQIGKLNLWKTVWHEDLIDALQACGGRALIFHNELVDAFPVSLLEWDTSAQIWNEVWLQHDGVNWQEHLKPFDLAGDFSALGEWGNLTLQNSPKQRVEVGTSYWQWLQSWAPAWKQGAMLTIDYGDLFPALYHRRPLGTLRAYLLHQQLTGKSVYENMGRQDITTDVNFTDLMKWGRNLGLENDSLLTQAQFIKDLLPDYKETPASAFLTDEYGAGAAFKVLVQRVGADQNRLRA